MSEIVKGFSVVWDNNRDPKIVDAEVDVTTSRTTGVWLVDGEDYKGPSAFRMVVGNHNEADAARAYAAHRKALGCGTSQVYRLFPLLADAPIAEDQLGDTHKEVWSAFADVWVEVRL